MSLFDPPTSKKPVGLSSANVPPRIPVANFADHPIEQPNELDFLKQIESVLIRMLIGVFKFPFVRLPRLIIQLMTQVSPTFVAISKITALAAILLIIVCTPALYAWFFEEVNAWLRPHISRRVIDLITTHKVLARIACYSLSTVLGIGAAWGAIYLPIRKRLRKRKDAAKKAPLQLVTRRRCFKEVDPWQNSSPSF